MTEELAHTREMAFEQSSRIITAKSRSNFSSAFFFLTREKRMAIRRVYAFFRVIDDIVDDELQTRDPRELLLLWKKSLEASYAGPTKIPLMDELRLTIDRFRIPREYFLKLIEGCEMDLVKKRYATFEELYAYCYRVASMVGLVCMKIFEYESPTSQESAANLGIALQLINIIRDVGIDLEKGRIYIPRDEMDKFYVTENDLIQKKGGKPFADLMEYQYRRACEYYQKGFEEFEKGPRRQLLAARIMGVVYFKILKKIRRKNYPVLHRRISLTFPEKMGTLAQILLK